MTTEGILAITILGLNAIAILGVIWVIWTEF